MPSKNLKHQNSTSLWKAASNYAESELTQLATALASEVKLGDRILLEGPMGVGKTTFVRPLLAALGVHQPPEGSPTFAIAHEYDSPRGGIVHIDYYRLKHESEIDDAGLLSYYWERDLIVISEWLSSWPDFEKQVPGSGRIWRVSLSFYSDQSSAHGLTRDIKIEKYFPPNKQD